VKNSQHAFSLIELLISLAIVLIMFSMFMGRSSKSRQQRDIAQCQKNLQSIQTALSLYATDNREKFPFVAGAKTSEEPLSLLIPRSTTVTEIFICPGTKDSRLPEGEPFRDRKISYAYYMGLDKSVAAEQPILSDRQINAQQKKSGEALFSKDGEGAGGNHHKFGGNVAFIGGDVRQSSPKAEFDLPLPPNTILLNPKP
jgi:prepilin-type N-terminal cleavage/methylation domain-containing protein